MQGKRQNMENATKRGQKAAPAPERSTFITFFTNKKVRYAWMALALVLVAVRFYQQYYH